MRRSAAPSVKTEQKRTKFSTPFKENVIKKESKKTNDSDLASKFGLDLSDESGICHSAQLKGRDMATRSIVEIVQSNSTKPKHTFQNPTRENLLNPKRTSSNVAANNSQHEILDECYFSVVWCKVSTKKHKKWEGDGLLITRGKSVVLKDMEGKEIAKGSGYKTSDLTELDDGSTLIVCGKEIEVQGKVDKADYQSGKCFSEVGDRTADSHFQVQRKFKGEIKPFTPHQQSFTAKKKAVAKPRHDPSKVGALVMPRPPLQSQCNVIDVVVDPFISYYLRPHQREGVTFLYTCVMGFKNTIGHGALLADEMGLGKTLQCIALVWTLLKQGPYNGVPVVKKIVIVTPGSLVKNWCKEFIKWLGSERILPFAVDSSNRVDEFLLRPKSPVLIISYEMFLRCIDDIRKVKFDMIICDEAHRLKNAAVKTATAVSSLAVTKRVLLTGTPIQNNLQEFYALAEMANPGILGLLAAFKKVFAEPIATSQQPHCSSAEKELGTSRAEELSRLTSTFCLRRTAEINKAYLPPKVEYAIFIQMTDVQLRLYQHLLRSRLVRACLLNTRNTSKHLVCISALKKLCNHPKLLFNCAKKHCSVEEHSIYDNLLPLFPEDYSSSIHSHHSAKFNVLSQLLERFISQKEKVVIVSNSTKMLDILQEFCNYSSCNHIRLDGQTQVKSRQDIVDRFNDKKSDVDVFLLSSKAGGVGLNLTGASKLILYDIDWNPANDMQAMARVWRDGQKRQVDIYRFLLTGTIEEKMYQRQIIKQGLSCAVVDSLLSETVEFSKENLRDLFTFKPSPTCCTHELLECDCTSNPDDERTETSMNSGTTSHQRQTKNMSMAELMRWEHIHDITSDETIDEGLKGCENISFIFRNKSSC